MQKICEICGKPFEPMKYGQNRKYCYDCSPHISKGETHGENITIKRRAIKKALVDYKGGCCERCGYNKSLRALEFHHLNPLLKDFQVSKQINRNFQDLKNEVDKCILVCSNCHAEIHEELSNQGFNQFNSDI